MITVLRTHDEERSLPAVAVVGSLIPHRQLSYMPLLIGLGVGGCVELRNLVLGRLAVQGAHCCPRRARDTVKLVAVALDVVQVVGDQNFGLADPALDRGLQRAARDFLGLRVCVCLVPVDAQTLVVVHVHNPSHTPQVIGKLVRTARLARTGEARHDDKRHPPR